MNTKRPSTGPPSQRQLSKQLGISRAKLWRATKVAEIPEDEFEALIESENPPTVSARVELGRGKSIPTAVTGLRNLQRAWNRATEQDQAAFLEWVSGASRRTHGSI